MLNQYELLYIVPAQFTEDELTPVKQKVREVIEKAGGKISLEDNLGKKKLAYPIKKMFQGYYLLNHFEMESSGIEAFEKDLRLTDHVLRHMVVHYEPKAAMKLEDIKAGISAFGEEEPRREERKVTPPPPQEKPKELTEEEKKVNLEELDKKLDEILKTDDLL